MMLRVLLITIIWFFPGSQSFRESQKKFPRVKEAYVSSLADAEKLFKSRGLDLYSSEIFLKVHKYEQQIQLWAKAKGKETYTHLKDYPVCSLSGEPGPKRMRGDLQTPEGFYYIDRYNPSSSYHLSLGINYPNKCDRFHCGTSDPGGDIFIHGKCVTIGCLPITDELIKELYLIAVEARNGGQEKIQVAIFPCNMSSPVLNDLLEQKKYASNRQFWNNLKEGFDMFERNKKLPVIRESNGLYSFN